MAPTSLMGRDHHDLAASGRRARQLMKVLPLHMCANRWARAGELQPAAERVALNDMKNIMKAKRAVKKSARDPEKWRRFLAGGDPLSPCPTIMKMDPVVARHWVGDTLVKAFPLGVFRDHTPELPVGPKIPVKTVEEVLGIDAVESKTPTDGRHHRHTRELTVKIAGFGGQGILLMGQLLAEMGLREHMEVSWLPSAGPEMRSGSAHCHVTLSHDRIGIAAHLAARSADRDERTVAA